MKTTHCFVSCYSTQQNLFLQRHFSYYSETLILEFHISTFLFITRQIIEYFILKKFGRMRGFEPVAAV